MRAGESAEAAHTNETNNKHACIKVTRAHKENVCRTNEELGAGEKEQGHSLTVVLTAGHPHL